MFVRGPAFWQSAATCRVPLRPSCRCSTLAVGLHLRPVACMQIASSHPATGVTASRVQRTVRTVPVKQYLDRI